MTREERGKMEAQGEKKETRRRIGGEEGKIKD